MKKTLFFLISFLTTLSGDKVYATKQVANDPGCSLDGPLVLSAKSGTLNQLQSILSVKGNVVARQKKAAIYAHQIFYDLERKTMTFKGKVQAQYSTGDHLFCDDAVIDTSLTSGMMHNVRSVLRDGARLTAQSISKKGKDVHVKHASYTPCHICQDRLDPLWSLHADHIEYDEKTGKIHYKRPRMKMWGYSLFALPSFGFLTKRSSGILPVMASYSQELGYYASLPVYWAIGPDQDATLTPYLMTTGGAMLAGEYRYHFPSGLFDVSSAVNVPLSHRMYRRWKEDRVNNPSQRGFVHNRWHWDIDAMWRLRSDVWWSGDKTFLSTRPFFGNASAPFLTSDTTLEGFVDHSFVRLRGLMYQDLVGFFSQTSVPYVLPELVYEYSSPLIDKKHRFFCEGKAINLYRNNGRSIRRFVVDSDWSFFDTLPWGQSLFISGVYKGAFYHLSEKKNDLNVDKNDHPFDHNRSACHAMGKNESRSLVHHNALFFAESRWPLYHHWGTWTPVMQLIVTPPAMNIFDAPNEDSQVILFDDRNLFDQTRYLGYDRLDRCSRLNYGYEWLHMGQDGHASFLIGQSYAFSKPNDDLLPVGVRKGFSDIVLRANWNRNDHDIAYRVRLNPYSKQMNFQDMTWSFGSKKLYFLGTYEFFKEKKFCHSGSMIDHYHQLYVSAASQWGFWKGRLFLTRNLGIRHALMDHGFSLSYKNECLDAGLTVQKSFYRQRDMVPGITISFHFRFKNLGGMTHRAQRFAQEV